VLTQSDVVKDRKTFFFLEEEKNLYMYFTEILLSEERAYFETKTEKSNDIRSLIVITPRRSSFSLTTYKR